MARWLIASRLLLVLSVVGYAGAQDGIEVVPGRPWTATVANPDKFDWNRTNRPGYRFRGMLPLHQRFYEYIKAKRARGDRQSLAENLLIRRLTALRRWPEPPRPNPFWRAYLQYLRSRPTTELNLANRLMLAQLFARGLSPMDAPNDAETKRMVEFLNSRPYVARSWLEQYAGRAEDWAEYGLAAGGADLAGPAATGNTFPPRPIEGMQFKYAVTGATLGAATDKRSTRDIKGTLGTGTLSVTADLTASAGFFKYVVYVQAGRESKMVKEDWTENPALKQPTRKTVTVSVPIRAGSDKGQVKVDMLRGTPAEWITVNVVLTPAPVKEDPERAAADAKWRTIVENTLAQLGAKDTPAEREGKAMREALAGGDSAWRDYVESKHKELGYGRSGEAQQLQPLSDSLAIGGDTWNEYARKLLGTKTLPRGIEALPDVGGVQVGTGTTGGQAQAAANRFAAVPGVTCVASYTKLAAGSTILAVWARDGQEVSRARQACQGTGAAAFRLGGTRGQLPAGSYTVELLCGASLLGRKSFVIAPTGVTGSLAEL